MKRVAVKEGYVTSKSPSVAGNTVADMLPVEIEPFSTNHEYALDISSAPAIMEDGRTSAGCHKQDCWEKDDGT